MGPRFFATILLAWACTACATTTSPLRVLPLKKVRLYETGVGYFERTGEVTAGGATLPVPSGHVDDAIKSLVVLSAEGSVRDVAFDSRLSPAVARARAGLPADVSADLTFLDLLGSLRGAAIELRLAKQTLRGRLVDIEPAEPEVATKPDDAPSPPKVHAVMMTREGEFLRVDTADIRGVRPIDSELRARYEAALDATVALRSNSHAALDVFGSSSGPVTLGYLAEAPVWRTTYRLVFARDAPAPTLQGWALVHNDTDEHWRGVAVELVNGRPDSFLFPLAAPRYERRELEVPDRELSSVPQLLTTTPDALWGDFADDTGGFGLSGTGYGGGGSGSGSGQGYGGRGSIGHGTRVPKVTGSELLEVGDLASVAEASGRETQTVFIYAAPRPLSLAPHRSAMVPFLHREIEATPLVWFDGFTDDAARHAIRVVNTTTQTLPEGPLSVFADGGFAGETMLVRLKPGERQFVEIGDDPDTELEVIESKRSEQPKRLVFVTDQLELHYLQTTETSLTLRNRTARDRLVHVALTIHQNATIRGTDATDFDLARSRPLAIFRVKPGAEPQARSVTIVEGLSRRMALAELSAATLTALAEAASLPTAEREVLKLAVARQTTLEQLRTVAAENKAEIATIEKDLERLRGHLQALGNETAGAAKNPLLTRLLAVEDRLEAARKRGQTAEANVTAAVEAVRAVLEKLAPKPK